MNIKIPFEFVWQDGVFGWLLDDAAKDAVEKAVAEGRLARETADEMLATDDQLRRLPGVFAGDLLFRAELDRDAETTVWRAAHARAMRAIEQEMAEAKTAGREPLTDSVESLASDFAFQLRAEKMFQRIEGQGAENFRGWDSLPSEVRAAVPARLAQEQLRERKSVDDLLKKRPAASRKPKAQ